jgi:hypothetical protein
MNPPALSTKMAPPIDGWISGSRALTIALTTATAMTERNASATVLR